LQDYQQQSHKQLHGMIVAKRGIGNSKYIYRTCYFLFCN